MIFNFQEDMSLGILKRYTYIGLNRVIAFIAIALFAVSEMTAQVTVTARLDSVQFYVGQQDGLEVQVSFPADKTIQLPPVKKGMEIIPNVEVVEVLDADTVLLNEGKQLQVTQRYIITAWDSAFYYLPPVQVKVDTSLYESKSLAFRVYTLDVDTLNADKFFPPRDIQELPFCWDDWKVITYESLIILVLAGLIIYLSVLIRKGKPIFHMVRRKKKLPPHQVAIAEIQRIKQDRTLTQENNKEYYTQLTDALRIYIQERYGFSAMEMTSSEIIEHLMNNGDETSLNELKEIFSTADLVKFANWSTQINENDANLMSALQYINDTKVEEDPTKAPEPEVVKETDKQRQIQVIVMRVAIGVALLVIVFVLGSIAWRLYDMFC